MVRTNKYADRKNIKLEHYVISSGLKEIIEGTKIAHEFKEIYAAEFFMIIREYQNGLQWLLIIPVKHNFFFASIRM